MNERKTQLNGEPLHDQAIYEADRHPQVAGEDPHFGDGETTDDDEIVEAAGWRDWAGGGATVRLNG